MRQARKEREKQQKKKLAAGYVLAAIYAIVLALFVITILRLNVLPMMYFVILAVVLGGISAAVIWGLLKKPKMVKDKDGNQQPAKKIASSVIAVILIIVLGFGTFYMGGTLDFFGKISGDTYLQTFYVVVKQESPYEKLKDIKGETVGIMSSEDEAYEKAKDKLKRKVRVDYAKAGDSVSLANSLVKDEYKVIFLNSAYYEMSLEEVEGFTTETVRILEENESKGVIATIIDAPVLFESGFDKMCDVTVCVTAPTELKINRILKRDNIPIEKAKARLQSQLSDGSLRERCDYEIVNDDSGSLEDEIIKVVRDLGIAK